MKTAELEFAIFNTLRKIGTYLCFEVMMPTERMGVPNERVDLISYNTKGEWRFYEIKVSKSDFYSKNKHTFLGNLNYFVMPLELYEQVQGDIPKDIGTYIFDGKSKRNGFPICVCVKKANRQVMMMDIEKLKHAFIQALSREHEKYRMLLAKTSED